MTQVPDALRRASWIWPLDLYAPLTNVFADFARDVQIDDAPAGPTLLHLTADAGYVLWVNGRYVGRGPARGWQASWPFDTHDVTEFLRPGTNRVAVRVHNPGRSTFRYVHENMAGLLLAMEGAGGVVTDAEWRCRVSPSRRRITPRLTIQLEDQEHVDLRRGDLGWVNPDVPLQDADDLPPRREPADPVGTYGFELRWAKPMQVRAFGTPPWHALESRGLPHVTRSLHGYAACVAMGELADAPPTPLPNPAMELFDALPSARWSFVETDAESVTIPATAEGEGRAAVLDFGGPTLGSLRLSIEGGAAGATLDLVPFEARADDGRGPPMLPEPRYGCRVQMGARLVLSGQTETFETFHTYGHRYLALMLRGGCDAPVRVSAQVRETLYPTDDAGTFESSDEQLDATRAVCARTQRVNMTDAYIDAWREQAQWWGDARVQFANGLHIAPDDALLRRGLRQVATQRLPNGLTYGHVPTAAHTCVLPDFSLIWLLTLHDHWWQTGDAEAALAHRGDVERLLGYFDGEGRDGGGLLRYDPRYWLFLDWADVPKEGSPTLLNLWYVHALERLSRAYRAGGEAGYADELSAASRRHAGLVRETLFDADRSLWRDGLDESGQPRHTYGTHAQTLAILAGFEATDAMRSAVADALEVREARPAEPSCYWITHVFEAGRMLGLGDAVVRCVRERWRPMVRQGSTFEVWTPTAAESRSHAWAAHPMVHLPRIVCGVAQSSPGWDRIDFAPALGVAGLTHARTVVPTPRGPVDASWRSDGEAFRVRLSLPEGVEADARLAGIEEAVAGTREWVVRQEPSTNG